MIRLCQLCAKNFHLAFFVSLLRFSLLNKMRLFITIIMLLIFPFISEGTSDTIIVSGINGSLNAGDNPEMKMVVKSRRNEVVLVDYFTLLNGEWIKSKSEKAKKIDANNYRVSSGKGRNRMVLIREYTQLPDSGFQFVETIGQQLVRRGTTLLRFPILPHGTMVSYYPEGPVKSEEIYNINEMISNKNWLENGLPYIDDLFYSVDRYPAYSGGNEQINRQIMTKMKEKQIDFSAIAGTLEIAFVVFENGKIGAFRVLKSIDPFLENLIIDAIRSLEGEWLPARLNDRNVRFFQTFPIHFNHYEMQVEFFDYYSGLVQFERK